MKLLPVGKEPSRDDVSVFKEEPSSLDTSLVDFRLLEKARDKEKSKARRV